MDLDTLRSVNSLMDRYNGCGRGVYNFLQLEVEWIGTNTVKVHFSVREKNYVNRSKRAS